MKATKIRRATIERAVVQLPAGRCLRIDLTWETDGSPGALSLALGWDSSERPDPARSIHLPGYLIRDVIEALQALEEGGNDDG